MNCIVLEGVCLYIFLALIILLTVISALCLICAIVADRRIFCLENIVIAEKCEAQRLNNENFILKLKCGEFDIDE